MVNLQPRHWRENGKNTVFPRNVFRARDVSIRKVPEDYETKRAPATLHVCKKVWNTKNDRKDIDRKIIQITAIGSFLKNLAQILATSETVAVPHLQI
jgi:hypothetical protein